MIWSVNQKVSGLVTVVAVIMLGFAGVVYRELGRNAASAEDLAVISKALTHHLQADMMHDALRADVLAARLAGAGDDGTTARSLEEHIALFQGSLEANTLLPLDAPTRAALAEVKQPLEDYTAAATRLVRLAATDPSAAAAGAGDFSLKFQALEGRMAQTSALLERRAQAVRDDAERERRAFWWVLAAGLAVCLSLIALVGWLVARSIPLAFRVLIDALAAGADQVDSASTVISSSSQALAQSTSHQAGALEETSASLEELATSTRNNAGHAANAKALTGQMREAADRGADDMAALARAMEAIQASGNNIAAIIKTIDEIAFQTNILALNAAVEAARAGEAGQGFAVVATEVRNLAHRSAEAARQTADRIEDSIQKAAAGVQLNARVSRSLSEIVLKARQADELVAGIASASREQSQGVDELNRAVTQLDQLTQRNAASAEESASVSNELKEESSRLGDSVVELQALVGGHAVLPPPAKREEGPGEGPHRASPKAPASTPSRGEPALA